MGQSRYQCKVEMYRQAVGLWLVLDSGDVTHPKRAKCPHEEC